MPDMNEYVYGVGFKLNTDSLNQAKKDLKLNLDTLSKMVKSYGNVLKIDPNADLSKLFDEMRKIKSIVDAVGDSDVSFGNFVDKGTLSRIATLENGLKSISETSETVEASIADLRSAVSEVTNVLKQAGSIKFPATFDNLFADKSQKVSRLQVKVKQLESVMQQLRNSYKAFQDSSDQSLDENINLGEISTWIKEFQILQKKIADGPKTGRKLNELYADLLKISELGQKLNMVMGASGGQDILKNLGLDLDSKDGIVFSQFLSSIPKQIETLVADVAKQRNKLKQELNQLGSADLSSKAKRSLGVAVNADGSNYTLRAKIVPDTDEVSWANTINDTIKNIEPRLSPVRLTPTFSNSSKNLQKEVDGNLAQINHAINVDLQVHDNLTQFNEKIKHIDASIKNAKQQLEKNGNFTIKFDYEEGGKFKDTAYQIINKFKKIDAHFYVANGKTFLKDIAGIKEKAKKEFKDIPITLAVGNKDKVLESVIALRNDISKKVDNIGVNLNIQNVPQVIQQAAIMRDSIEQYYENNPIGNISGPSGIDADADSASRSIVELSEKAKKAQADVEKIKSALKSLTELGFKSPDFLKLGAFDKDGKYIKGSKEQVQQILQGYDELYAKVHASKKEIAATYGTGDAGYQAYQSDLNMLEQTEGMLKQILQGQIQYSQKRLELAEQTLVKEKQVAQEKAKQTRKTVQDSAQSQTVQEIKNNKQLTMSADEAAKKVRSLNATLSQQKKVLKDLDAQGINAASFTKLGEWDKDSKSFKKNSQEIQELLKRYKELQKARLAAGGTKAVGEEASLRGKLAAILKEQKKHVTEIVSANQSELASVKAIVNAQKQASASKSSKQQAANTKAATAEQDKLNKKIKQQQQILNDLNKNGWQSKYFAQLGTWDKETQKFKKNTNEMQILIKQYADLKKAREDAGIKTPIAGSEELKLRGRIGALLKEQKKHVAEIIAKNQEELKSAQKTADAYKQVNAAKADTDKKPVASAKGVEKATNAVDELNASLEKAKQALNLLQSGKIDVVKSTGLGDISKRIDASGIKQSLNWIVNRYKILLTKKQEFEKAGATGSDEYVRNEKQIQIYEQLLSNIYQDQLKHTQSRIGQLETEIAKRKEILALQEQQGKAEATQQVNPKEQKKQQVKSAVVGEKKATGQIPKDASSVVKLDGATLKSLAKDATLKSIEGKLSNILSSIQKQKPVQAGGAVTKTDKPSGNISQQVAANAEKATKGQKELNNELEKTQQIASPLAQAMSAGMQDRINRANALSRAGIKISRGTLLKNGNEAFDQILKGTSPKDAIQNIIWPKLVTQLKAKGLTDTDQFQAILEQVAKNSVWKSKTSSSWIHFETPGAKFNDKITKKAYASFADVGEISSELINQILSELKSKGYKGQIKIPSDITGFYDADQLVGHAADDKSFMILIDVLKSLEKHGTLANIQTGVDANTKVSFGAKGKQGASFTTMLEEIYKAAPGQVFSIDEIKSIIKSAVVSTSGDVDQALFKPIVEDVIRKRSDQVQNVSDMGQNEKIATSAERATKEQSELNAELAETAQKDGVTQGTINDNIAQDAERATQEQKELNDEVERTQKLASSVVTHNEMTGDVSKIVDTYKSDDKVNETQEVYGWVRHGKDNPPTFEHTATVTKTNMEAYNKLYQDYIKSLSKQLEIEQKIGTTKGPTSKLQEDLKAQKEITDQLESQLQKHSDLFTEQSKQAAMAEATKNANQATATSNAKVNDAAINKQITALNKAADSAQQKYKDILSDVNALPAATTSPIKQQFVEYEQLFNKLKIAQREIANNPQLLNDESYVSGLKQLLSQLNKAESEFNNLSQSAQEFKHNIRNTSDIKVMDNAFDANNISQMHDEMRKFANAAGLGEAKLLGFNDVNRTATFEIKNGKGQVQQLTVAYNEATNALGRYVSKTTEGTSGFSKFFDGIKKSFGNVVRYLASFGSVYELFAVIRQGVTYVREIDAALTELKKVTDETDASYDRFLQNMSKTAGTVGSTVAELTQMAAEWSRLGYSMKDAAQLAESTAILLNVSEFSDATQASEALISTMQAFGYAADESQHVVDILNEVGNNYAVSSDGIATALQDSASALMEAGNTLEQSTALVAAANKVVQDPNSVGSALRTISLRLRGTSVEILEEMGEETDGVVESTSKLQEKLQALTGVNILTDSGTYKDTYTILKEIGEVWQDLGSMDQAAALELMAGKNRANTLAAILNNMEDLTGAYESAMDAEGSAMQENAAYLDSIQGRIDLFNNAVQTMWMNFMNDDAVKFIVDLGTSLVKLVDTMGVIPTAVGAFSAFKLVAKSIGKDFADMGDEIREAMNISSAEKSAFEVADAIQDVAKAKEEQADATMANAAAKQAENVADNAGVVIDAQETAQIEQNTDAQRRNTDANMQNAASDVQDNVLDASGATIEALETAQIEQNTRATIANTVAQKAANVVKTLGKGLLFGLGVGALTAAVGAIMGVIDDLVHAEERAIERADEAINKYRDSQDELKDQKKTTDELAESYTRLSSGVNTLTNDNIGLTVDAYNEYLDVCNQIANMYPELVQGYDAQGNAILSLTGKVDDLTASYIRAQEEAANTLLTSENKKDIWTKYKSNIDIGGYSDYEGNYIDITAGHVKQVLEAVMAMGSDELNQFYMADKEGGTYDGANMWDLLRAQMQEMGTYIDDAYMTAAFNSLDVPTKEELKSIKNYTSYITQNLSNVNQEISDGMNGIIEATSASLIFDPIYQKLDEESKGIVKALVNSIDPSMVDKSGAKNTQDFIDWFSSDVIAKVANNQELYSGLTEVSNNMAKAISGKDNDAFTAAQAEFNEMVKDWVDESGNIVVDSDADFVTQYFQNLAQAMQNEAKNYAIRVQVQTDVESEYEGSGTIGEVLSRYSGDVQEQAKMLFDDLLGLDTNALMSDVFNKISVALDDGDGKLRVDEISDIYQDFLDNDLSDWSIEQQDAISVLDGLLKLYGTDFETFASILVDLGYVYESLSGIKSFDLTSEAINEDIDDFQESIKSIKDAWELLNSGEMTKSEFIDLAQQFPDLMENIDFSDDNWMVQAKENLEELNKTTIADFIEELEKMKETMDARGEDTSIVDQFIAYAKQMENLNADEVTKALKANTLTGLTETYEKYKSIMEETNQVMYNGQKVSEGYYETLSEYIDDTGALSACFDENNKQIVTNVSALKELIAAQKEADMKSVAQAKAQAQLKYYELVRALGDATRAETTFQEGSDETVDSLTDQIGIIKNTISQYKLLEDSLLGTTSAFEKFTKAKETDEQNTYGASYVEMVQTMYDALYKTGETGTAQFWAAVEATIPEDEYKHLTPGQEQLNAISRYLNDNLLLTLTLDEDTFSIDYSNMENFVKKAQEAGAFFGTDETYFGISADFIYNLQEGENALEAFAKLLGMTVPQVYAYLSEIDKYTADGTGLSMLMQLDQSTTGQIAYATSLLEGLYAKRQQLIEQGENEDVLGANLEEIYKYEAYISGLQKQATDESVSYSLKHEVLDTLEAVEDTGKKIKEVLPKELITKLQLRGDDTVEDTILSLKGDMADLKVPTVVELEIAKQNIEDELAGITARLEKNGIDIDAHIKPDEDSGLYEIVDGTLKIDASSMLDLQRAVELLNASTYIDESLTNALSTTEQFLSSIDGNVAKIAGEDSSADNKTEETTQDNTTPAPNVSDQQDGTKPAPDTYTADTITAFNSFIHAIDKTLSSYPSDKNFQYDQLVEISKRAQALRDGIADLSVLPEDANAELSELKTRASMLGVVTVPVTTEIDWSAPIKIDEENVKEATGIEETITEALGLNDAEETINAETEALMQAYTSNREKLATLAKYDDKSHQLTTDEATLFGFSEGMTVQEVIDKIKQDQEKISSSSLFNPFENYKSFKFDQQTNEDINEFQESMETIKEAWESLNSGEMTTSEFVDLAQQFPDLMNGVNLSDDNWMTQAKTNLEALNNNLVDGEDGLVTKLNKVRAAMVSRGEDTSVIDSVIAYLNSFKNLSVEDILSFDLANEKVNEFVDEFQDSMGTIRDAWESLNSGEMTESEFLDLAQQFPEIMDGVDFSQDNWTVKAKENIEQLNETTITDFISELERMKKAMAANGENTAIVDSVIAYANSLKDMPTIATELLANTITGITEAYENYKSVMAEADEVFYNGQIVSADYYESLSQYIDDTEALNQCFDENNKQIITNVDLLKQLITQQKEAIINGARLSKSYALNEYDQLAQKYNEIISSSSELDDETLALAGSYRQQMLVVLQQIDAYSALENSLNNASKAFENFKNAQELDSQITYGEDYTTMAQTAYDALYTNREVGTNAFIAAMEGLLSPDEFNKALASVNPMQAFKDAYDKFVLPQFTFGEDALSIDFTDVEEFVQDALDNGVFTGDISNFDLVEGMNLEEAARLMGVSEAYIQTMFSLIDKYNANPNMLSFLSRISGTKPVEVPTTAPSETTTDTQADQTEIPETSKAQPDVDALMKQKERIADSILEEAMALVESFKFDDFATDAEYDNLESALGKKIAILLQDGSPEILKAFTVAFSEAMNNGIQGLSDFEVDLESAMQQGKLNEWAANILSGYKDQDIDELNAINKALQIDVTLSEESKEVLADDAEHAVSDQDAEIDVTVSDEEAKEVLERLEQQIREEYSQANVDLLMRPKVDWTEMNAAGWNTPEGSYSTVDTVTFAAKDFGLSDEGGQDYAINVTPILPDGTVIQGGTDGLWQYINDALDSGNKLEDLEIFLGSYDTIEEAERAAQILHEYQEAYYALKGEIESTPIEPDVELSDGAQQQLKNDVNSATQGASLWTTPDQPKITGIQTYSELVNSMSVLNDVLSQTDEIIANNTEVTQEYKDTLAELLDVEVEELSEYFDKTNPLLVKNADGLKDLAKQAKQNTQQNIKLAKSQAQLEYYELYKEMRAVVNGAEIMDSATLDHVNSLYAEMSAIQSTIAKYSLLEAKLLGTANAYDKLAEAQEADNEMDYGSKAEELANVLVNAFTTGELGTQAAQTAIEGLIPQSVIEDAKEKYDDLDDIMQHIYNYATNDEGPIKKLFEFEFDDDGNLTSVEMTSEKVHAFTEELIKADKVFHGTFDEKTGGWDNFELDSSITDMESFAKALGVTKEVAFAYLTELEKFDISWLSGDYETLLDQLMGNDAAYLLQKSVQEAAEAEKELAEIRERVAKGELSKDSTEYQQAKTKADQAYTNIEQQEDAMVTSTFDWSKKQEALDAEADKLEELQAQYKSAYEAGEDTKELEQAITDTSSRIDDLLIDLAGLEEPTELVLEVASDEAQEHVEQISNELNSLAEGNEVLLNVKTSIDSQGFAGLTQQGLTRGADGKWNADAIITGYSELDSASQAKVQEYLNKLEQQHYIDLLLGENSLSTESQLERIAGTLERIAQILDPTYTLSINTKGDGQVSSLKSAWDSLKSKTITLTQKVTQTVTQLFKGSDSSGTKDQIGSGGTGKSGFSPHYVVDVNGTAHVKGTAYKGGSWGATKTETALTGELGPELRVRGNRWELLGENGAEFNEVKKGDIIFNHKQTEQLLTNGYITGRGKAFAEGTVGGAAYSGVDRFNTTSNASQDFSGNSSNKNNSSNSSKDAKDEFEELFDWIEVRLEEINEDIDLKSAKLENTIGATKQNAVIDDLIELHQKLYENLTSGAEKYNSYAKTLLAKIPAEYRKAAQDGSIAIEEFAGEAGEETLEAIQKYREWVQKGADATQQAEEVLTEIQNLAKQAIDNIAQEYENKASIPAIKIEQLEAYNALIETTQGAESAKIYKEMIKANNKQIEILQSQRNKMQQELNEQVEAGNIKKYSQAWYDAVGEIAAVDTEIINLTTDTENYQDAMNELHWEHFDNLLSRFEAISNEAENLVDILGEKDLVDKDTGEWTDEGITSLGLYAQQMEVAEMQSKKYKEEIQYLNKNWKKLGYTEQEYVEKLEELKEGQYDSIKAYNDSKKAMVDLTKVRVDAIKKGIEKEIEAYEELIQKQKEALDAEKDIHDFEKTVADQQKTVADIERKLAALEGDNSASARAQRAKLQAELAKANADLEEIYYDRSVSNKQDALDKELEAFRDEKNEEMESWDEYLEDTEQVVADSLATIQANTDAVYDTLTALGQEYSLSIADALTSPWEQGENAIQSYSEKFGLSMSATVTELKKVAEEYKNTIAEIEQAGQQSVGTVTQNVSGYQEATYQEPDKKEEETTTTTTPTQQEENITLPKKGSKVKVKEGTTHWGAKSSNKKMASWVPGNTYTVSNTYGSGSSADILLSKKDKDGKTVYMGWINVKDLEGYAKGTTGVKNNQFALIDELGEELVIRPSKGRMTFMEKGTGVVPADLTSNLMGWGELDPSVMLERNKPEIKVSPEIHNTEFNLTMDIAEVVHIDRVDNETLPDLTKAIDKQLDKYMKNLNNQIRRYVR